MKVESDLWNADQVGEWLGVSEQRVRQLVRLQGLPAIRMTPRVLRFRREEIQAWLDERRERNTGGRNEAHAA